MKKYTVYVPFTGEMIVYVEAENEEDAKRKATATDVDCTPPENVDSFTWEFHEHVTKGNVFYGERNSIEVVEVED